MTMSDVYAKVGIPMPPAESEPEFDPAKDDENKPMENPDAIDWAKRAEEERDRDIRLECLKLVNGSVRQDRVPIEAEKLFQYIKGGLVKPLMRHEWFCGTCITGEILDDAEEADFRVKQHMQRRHPEIHRKLYGD
jgi:hypothetical protein